jgi:hypothetical protein
MDGVLRDAIFALGPHIRYVALGAGQTIDLAQRDGLEDASDAGSDFFEELLVNPARSSRWRVSEASSTAAACGT